jgi:hypothetical protein
MTTIAALYSRVASLEKALGWALEYIADGTDSSLGETPEHTCEFITNPEKGACDFHDRYFAACATLAGDDTACVSERKT